MKSQTQHAATGLTAITGVAPLRRALSRFNGSTIRRFSDRCSRRATGIGGFLLVLGVAASAASNLPSPVFDAAKLGEIPRRMQEFVDKGEISGVVTLVATKDRVVHLAAVGRSDLASGRPMKADDLFWIASMSKPVTAVCVAMLADEGRLAFDDPVEKYLPEFRGQWLAEEQSTNRRVLVRPARPVTGNTP